MATGSGGGGAGGAGGDIRAGGAYFEVFGKDKLSPVLDKVQKKAKETDSVLSKLRKAAPLIAAGAGALGLGALFKGGMNEAAEAARMADRFQVPIELMSKMMRVAEDFGATVEEVMTDTTGRFSDAISKAKGIDSENARAALETEKAWADAIRDLKDATLPLIVVIKDVVEAFADACSWIKRQAMAVRDFFGGGGEGVLVGAASGIGGPDRAKNLNALRAASLSGMAATGVRGSFSAFNAQGQFGFGDSNSEVKKQTELLKQLTTIFEEGRGKMPDKIGDKLLDAIKPR